MELQNLSSYKIRYSQLILLMLLALRMDVHRSTASTYTRFHCLLQDHACSHKYRIRYTVIDNIKVMAYNKCTTRSE